jgi:hypothetical protein
MEKIVDLSKTVFELCESEPEIVEVMKSLGFDSITNPAMLKTAGRVMTIPKGAKMKGISMEQVRAAFKEHGFKIIE